MKKDVSGGDWSGSRQVILLALGPGQACKPIAAADSPTSTLSHSPWKADSSAGTHRCCFCKLAEMVPNQHS